MEEIPTRLQHLFIVRMWAEPAPTPQWRGSVECVATSRKVYFTALNDMNDFIMLQLSGCDPQCAKILDRD